MKKRIGLALIIVALMGISYSVNAQTVSPNPSFGNATHVKVATVGNTDLVIARNAKGDVFSGASWRNADGKTAWISRHEQGVIPRSRTNGAMANSSVKATIEHQVSKRSVIDEMLKKAKVGGKMLGKGAATVGRVAASNNPYVRAFNLVMLALEATNSGIKWDEDKAEFMRLNDDDTFVVFITNDYSAFNTSYTYTREQLDNFCKSVGSQSVNYVRTCFNFSYVRYAQLGEEMLAKCRMLDSRSNFVHEDGRCGGGRSSIYTEEGVKYARFASSVPVSEDDFYRLVEKEVDKNPSDWVETSEIKPTDEPKVEIEAGTIAQSDPYTDSKDKKVKQTRWDFEPNGRVRETVIPRPDLTPDSPEAPRLEPPSEADASTGDKDKDKEKDGENEKEKAETEDLCDKNPDILACDKQPENSEIDEFPDIPTETVNLKFAPDNVFPSQATCPAPVSFVFLDKTYAFSLQPACDLAEAMRAFIIATAFLMAAFFVVRTVQSEV